MARPLEVVLIIRSILSRTGVAVLAVSVALATAIPAQAAAPAPADPPGVEVSVVKQIANRADTRYCLTFVTSNKVPMSRSVGGALARTGACLDTGADLVATPKDAPVLVLPCRDGDGQKWNYD